MSTILNQRPVEFFSFKSVALLYDGSNEIWKVVGVKEKEPNTIIYQGDNEEIADKYFNMILEDDKQ
jgi:hypothetical protein|tara:strand:- start:365 stop:562 length:198 start_codon:yes stop_codon:yes gene_type:complete